jgi:hypothetical protein
MEMDDRFLHEHRRGPAPGFARRLREKLREQEETSRVGMWRPLVFAAAAAAVVATLFAFPAVRAGAQSMLDLFRVRNFVAVPFDSNRFEKLKAMDNDNAMLVFDRHEVIQEPGRPVVQSSVAAASALVGFTVETPSYLPRGLAADTIAVSGEGRARFGVSTSRLRELLATLDLRDVEVPAGLDGQDIDVHLNRVVSQRFRSERNRISLIQARSPEVSLPAGVDLSRLGEVGLRVLGLDAGEARRIASTVDWRSTLLVPVPANASSFRSVTVQGNPGLLVEKVQKRTDGSGTRSAGCVVMWTDGDRVFALEGSIGDVELLQVAESVR